MTEEESKLKRCCGPAYCGTFIAKKEGGHIRLCSGADCMAWRWDEKFAGGKSTADGHCGIAVPP